MPGPDRRRGPGEVTTPRQGPSVEIRHDTDSQSLRHGPGGVADLDGWRWFGEPSNYSLAPWELAAHIRRLRRQGWQSWEVRVRFDTRWAS
jgi:hypothetical protein